MPQNNARGFTGIKSDPEEVIFGVRGRRLTTHVVASLLTSMLLQIKSKKAFTS
jgi:hypothetical protein